MPQIKVKPLEWTTDSGILPAGFSQATTHVCVYVLAVRAAGFVQWLPPDGTGWHEVNSIEAAEAACQAHWEAAVMSCLEVEP